MGVLVDAVVEFWSRQSFSAGLLARSELSLISGISNISMRQGELLRFCYSVMILLYIDPT